MPLQATSGAASYDAFGGGVPVAPNYIEDVFRTHLYNGDTGGFIFASSGVSIVSGGMMWFKSRGSATSNYIFSPSLTSANHYLSTNATAAQSNSGVSDNNFEAVDNGGGMRFGGAYSGISSSATGPFASWTFRKQPKFFDVVTYTGTGANRTIAHNLGSAPGCMFVKRTDTTGAWQVYHRNVGTTKYLVLNTTAAEANGATRWNSTAPTSTVFSLGTATEVNASGGTYVAYLFAHDAGGFGLTGTDNVISCGTYTGNGSINGPIVTLGWEPQFLLIKNESSVTSWFITDNMRGFTANSSGGDTVQLFPNTTGVEANNFYAQPSATGFQITDTSPDVNGSGENYIYIAIRRGPMKVPTSGTSVFGLNARTGTGANATVTGGAGVSDAVLVKNRGSAVASLFAARLTGTNYLVTSSTAAQVAAGTTILQANPWDVMDGVKVGTTSTITNASSNTYINYLFDRAPSVFDVVCYTGTGSTRTVAHNLAVVPELMIIRRRSTGDNWIVYSQPTGATLKLELNATDEARSASGFFNSTAPTSTVFTVQTNTAVNGSGSTYVAYLFATCAGVSKVGSYTGNGTTQTINCGFGAGGARFVLIKRTDSTSGWYVYDTARGMTVLTDPYLFLNNTDAEAATLGSVTTVSTGFALNSTILAAINVSGGSYIFLAIA